MQHDHSLSLATTASGMLGGTLRAISEQVSLTLPGIIDIATYAVVSASVGYCVKVSMDLIHNRWRNRKSKK